jgi:hypothetical protein
LNPALFPRRLRLWAEPEEVIRGLLEPAHIAGRFYPSVSKKHRTPMKSLKAFPPKRHRRTPLPGAVRRVAGTPYIGKWQIMG